MLLILTLFDMGGGGGGASHVFDHCAQTLRRRKLKLGDFFLLIYGASKRLFFYHSNEFVTEYSTFSEVIIPYMFPYNEIFKVFKSKI